MKLQNRPDCSKCGASHTEQNRVNWWDSAGVPYGPQGKPDNNKLYLWCDKCAGEAFAGIVNIKCRTKIVKLPWTLRKDFIAMYDELYLESKDAVPSSQILKEKAVHVLLFAQKIIGFMIFDIVRESPTKKKYFVEIYGLYVSGPYRKLGFGRALIEFLQQMLSGTKVNYITLGNPLSLEEYTFLTEKFLDSISIPGFEECYTFKHPDLEEGHGE